MTIRAFTVDSADEPHMRYILESLEHIQRCDACNAQAESDYGKANLVDPICEWLNARVMPEVTTLDEAVRVIRTWLSLYDSTVGQLLIKRTLDS